MSRSAKNYLQHILLEMDFILENSQDLTQDDFFKDERLKRAFVRSLEVIGEASKNLSPDFGSNNPQIPWRRMAGMRDKLIHEYFGVDYDVIWDVISDQIPILRHEIKILIGGLLDRE
jgi:uncharacterized protein with HEPN domain